MGQEHIVLPYVYHLPTSKRDRPRTFVGDFFSYFSFLRSRSLALPSAHFFLNDLSKIPTNIGGRSLLPLIAYFFAAIFGLHITPFLHSTTTYVRNCAHNISLPDRLDLRNTPSACHQKPLYSVFPLSLQC